MATDDQKELRQSGALKVVIPLIAVSSIIIIALASWRNISLNIHHQTINVNYETKFEECSKVPKSKYLNNACLLYTM